MAVDLSNYVECPRCERLFTKTLHPQQPICGLCIMEAEFTRFYAAVMYQRWGVLPYES